MFYTGQKVVCIHDGLWYARDVQVTDTSKLPVKGEIYVITGFSDQYPGHFFLKGFEGGAIQCLGRVMYSNAPWAFNPVYFRPLVDKKDESFWTKGADPESKKWDLKVPKKIKKKEAA